MLEGLDIRYLPVDELVDDDEGSPALDEELGDPNARSESPSSPLDKDAKRRSRLKVTSHLLLLWLREGTGLIATHVRDIMGGQGLSVSDAAHEEQILDMLHERPPHERRHNAISMRQLALALENTTFNVRPTPVVGVVGQPVSSPTVPLLYDELMAVVGSRDTEFTASALPADNPAARGDPEKRAEEGLNAVLAGDSDTGTRLSRLV